MKKKIYKILLLTLFIIFVLTNTSFAQTGLYIAENSELFKRWENLSQEEKENVITPKSYNIGIKQGLKRSRYNTLFAATTSEQETTFNLTDKYKTIVKNQKLTNLCWAFAMTSMVESNVAIRNSLLGKEYSPIHMEYFAYKMFEKDLGDGGPTNMALAYMINGKGPVLESDFPMTNYYDEINNSKNNYYLTDIDKVDLDKTVQLKVTKTTEFPTIYKVHDSTTGEVTYYDANDIECSIDEVNVFRESIKSHIKEYGAVVAGMYVNFKQTEDGKYTSKFYDAENNYYCYTSISSPNHQVTIVGWDDNKQAYIVQNSYGEAFGDNGYFYVSYDDVWIEASVYGINNIEELTANNSYDQIYQYDELGANKLLKTNNTSEVYYANVFNREVVSEEDEYIKEVGLYILGTTGIEIYVNPNDGEFVDENNNSKLQLVHSGEILEPGYHVIKLNATESTKLTGDKFIIAVKSINQDEAGLIPIETNEYESGFTKYSTVYDKSKANAGESWYSFDGKAWNDINGVQLDEDIILKNTNVSVRAFTKYVDKMEETAVTGVSLDKTSVNLTEGETESLIATVLPETAINQSVTWESSNTAVATVTNGVITAVAPGTAKIKVITEEGNYTATCDVTVEEKVINVTGVTITPTTIEITEGETATLTAEVLPTNATNKNIIWNSSNTAVATVANGVVTALKAGKATITVTTADGNFSAECKVTVNEKIINVTGVTITPTEVDIVEGETSILTATVSPTNSTNKNVTWESSDEEIATISNGVVTGIKPGKVTITVKTEDGNFIARCKVTVTQKIVDVRGILIMPYTLEMEKGETYELTATVLPENATNKNITWKSSNESIATVTNGVVTALKAGEVTITVTTVEGGFSAKCEITVNEGDVTEVRVTGVNLNKTDEIMKVGETLSLTPTILPANATNKNIAWESSNEEVATISNGIVTALKEGEAIITVETEDGNYTASCMITVEKNVVNVTSVGLNKNSEILKIGKTLSLIPTVLPTDATNKNITWTSSNDEVATVINGVVTALKKGDAIITVETEDGNYTATCQITVEDVIDVTGVTLNKNSETLKIGETTTLIQTILPANASNKNVTWESSDEEIATVSSGIVTALKEGKTTIIVKTADGNHTATCQITVEKNIINVTDVVLNNEIDTINVGETVTLIPTIIPANASNKNVTWESSNEEIATVSSGVVTALKVGEVTITVKTEDGNLIDTCTIVVEEKIETGVKVESIELDKTELKMQVSDKDTLIVTFNPELPSNTKVKWESSNPEVVTVDENGIVRAVGIGSATITVTSEEGEYTAKCTVTVTEQVEDPDDIYKDPDDDVQGEEQPNDDTSMADKELPNAGLRTIISFVAIALLIAMGFSYIKYRRLKDVK